VTSFIDGPEVFRLPGNTRSQNGSQAMKTTLARMKINSNKTTIWKIGRKVKKRKLLAERTLEEKK